MRGLVVGTGRRRAVGRRQRALSSQHARADLAPAVLAYGILWVSSSEPNAKEREQLEAPRRPATALGAHLLVERGDVRFIRGHVEAAILRAVETERGGTQFRR